MRLTGIKVVLAVVVLTAFLAVPGFSQEKVDTQTPAPAASTAQAPEALPQAKEMAIYGEVQSVDAAKAVMTVQYYDYDSDSEKTSEIAVGADAKIENAPALGGIKKNDWVDVTYVVKDGINAAKVITVEKEELPATEEANDETAEPAAALPTEQ